MQFDTNAHQVSCHVDYLHRQQWPDLLRDRFVASRHFGAHSLQCLLDQHCVFKMANVDLLRGTQPVHAQGAVVKPAQRYILRVYPIP